MTQSPELVSLRQSLAARSRWNKTADRTAATQAMRDGLRARFEREVDALGDFGPKDRERRIQDKFVEHYERMRYGKKKKAEERRNSKAGPPLAGDDPAPEVTTSPLDKDNR